MDLHNHHSYGRQQSSNGRMLCLQGPPHVQHRHVPDEDLPVEAYYVPLDQLLLFSQMNGHVTGDKCNLSKEPLYHVCTL